MRIGNFLFLLTVLGFLIPRQDLLAQIYGLWEVTSVQVGSEALTPVARWTELTSDGSYASGNGWLQNGDGTWEFDEERNELLMTIKTGFEDSFGPFKVEMVSDDEMIWSREENGQMVIVKNKRIEEKPKHPATLAIGLWMVKQAMNGESDETERFTSEEFQGVFVRWDNLFQEITPNGRISGMWRVDAHRPVIDILYYDGSKPLQYWSLEFDNENTMTWTRDDLVIQFERLNAFPE